MSSKSTSKRSVKKRKCCTTDATNTRKKRTKKKANVTQKKPRSKYNKHTFPQFALDKVGVEYLWDRMPECPQLVSNPFAVYQDGTRDPPVELTPVQFVMYKLLDRVDVSSTTHLRIKTWFLKTDSEVYSKLVD